jgi:hypothetical protein
LIEQQFYKHGTDTIIGRTPEIAIKIKHSGLVVNKFKELFNNNLDLFIQGNYVEFFKPFTIIKGLDENHIKEIYQEIQIKLAAMQEPEIDLMIKYTIVLSSLISNIRDLQFSDTIDEIIKRVKKKKSIINADQIHTELDNLFMRNNKNISILYNLAYLDALADSFHFSRVAHTCKIQKSQYINHIVEIILSSSK